MAGALPGGVATGAAEGSVQRSGPRSGAPAGAKGQEFERMLGAPASNDAQRTTRPDQAQAPASEPTRARRDAAGASGEEVLDEAHASAAEPAKAKDADTASQEEASDWPPAGLAGLMLSIALPAAGPTPAAVDASATPAAGRTSPPLPAPVPAAVPAVANAVGTAAAGDPAASADAPPATDLPFDLDALLQASAADAGESSDGPPAVAPALHGIGALQALRAGAEVPALRGTGPTPTPVLGQDGFDEAISARVGWLAEQKIGHAHIRISPDDLGAIDVRLQLDGDKVHASFSSPHVEVRHALENSLPRLREMLGEQGFLLGNADVGQQAQGDSTPSQGHAGIAAITGNGDAVMEEVSLSSGQVIRQRGILDAYA